MWIAKIVYKCFSGGKLVVGVEFSNGKETFREDFVLVGSAASVKEVVASRVSELNTLASKEAALALGNIDLAPDTEPVPTAEEIARQTFMTDYNRWIKIKRAIDAGLITGSEPKVVQFKNKLLGEFKVDYLDIL